MHDRTLKRGVVAPFWLDRPGEEAFDIATAAEGLGYDEFWVGEMFHFDAFALAGAVARSTNRITVTVGPLALGLRDPVSLAMGVGSIEVIGERPARLAIGASSEAVVNEWHGRSHGGEAAKVGEALALIREVLSGEKTDHRGPYFRSVGFLSGLGKRSAHLTVAAAGPRMLAAAKDSADRILANLITPESAAVVKSGSGLPLAVWVVAAVEPSESGVEQVRRQIALYLGAPGYQESLSAAGMGELVARVADGARPRDVAPMISTEMMSKVAAIGSAEDVSSAVDAFERIGGAVMLVPVTVGDVGGLRTLRSLA